jgi:alpha-tubulin suppressor-like RCC1 family protein
MAIHQAFMIGEKGDRPSAPGALWVWGFQDQGALGNNLNTSVVIQTPITTFAGGNNWVQVNVRGIGRYALKSDGTLWTWGDNDQLAGGGNIGDNTKIDRSTPVTTFAGGNDWAKLASPVSGGNYSAAIKTDGTLWVWGVISGGGGTNNEFNIITPVTTFAGGTNWKQVSVGNLHMAAIKTDGTLWLWGGNGSLQLGINSDRNNRCTPVTTFAGGNDWKEVCCGGSHTMAIKNDGTLWTWGSNFFGQLGINLSGTTNGRSTPVTTFAGGTNWKQLGSGTSESAAIKFDGTLWTWGRNNNGQIGDNTTIDRLTPVTTFAGGNDWASLAFGGVSKSAIKTDGTLWTWGLGAYIGNNDSTNRLTPVTTFLGGNNWQLSGCSQGAGIIA